MSTELPRIAKTVNRLLVMIEQAVRGFGRHNKFMIGADLRRDAMKVYRCVDRGRCPHCLARIEGAFAEVIRLGAAAFHCPACGNAIVEEAIEHGTFDCLKRGRPPRLCLMEDYDRAIEQREEVGKALLHFRREVEVLKRDAADLAKVIERGGYCLAQMMNAYERRIRSDCTPEQIEKRPWECAEYVEARAYLCTMFPATDADADRG